MAASIGKLISVDYEVFGTVQGVFFRKFTQQMAKDLGLVGWVKNTTSNTVTGTIQGSEGKVNQMKHWLQHKGSPKSKITRCEFKNEKHVDSLEFSNFSIDRGPKKKKVRK
ncbi:hypothetical protein CAPTEDRAFT_123871 [Capitella teleta]|uniref:acylphosphatase n=1 Tax=Capitella teleta TaxID=283909 RepID=R7TWU9_CAPTE|nr:hypothetical protein CAPTEDRAFT_123871 [Capitella teleta]|eukprot:ELT98378.1 hypothetical protein CAPTEDRAFT_123871 [Capitella teleta]